MVFNNNGKTTNVANEYEQEELEILLLQTPTFQSPNFKLPSDPNSLSIVNESRT